jgi:thiol:disulfide interchange protein
MVSWELRKGYLMKKENVLVVVLIGLAVAGGFLYNRSKTSESVIQAAVLTEPPMETAAGTTSGIKGTAIGWNDYTPGMAMAGKGTKPIFLYFHASWCTYCTKLKQTTFKDKKILAYLEKNFVSIQVDTDKNQALSNEWKVKGLPTLWFLEPDGTKINSIPGYMDAAQLLQILKYIHTRSYNTMKFKDFIKKG